VSAQEHVGTEEDLGVLGDGPDHRLGVGRGAAVVGFGLDLGGGVHVGDHHRARVLGLPGAQLIGGDGVSQRAPGLEVGQEDGPPRGEDGGRLGHEVDPAEDDHVGIGLGGLAREVERITDEVGDVLHLGELVVVREDHRVALLAQTLDPRDQVRDGAGEVGEGEGHGWVSSKLLEGNPCARAWACGV
jgi:hypothetical protein